MSSLGVVSRLLQRQEPATVPGSVNIVPFRRRHLREAMPLERSAYETSWSRKVFESELDQVRDGSRYYVAAIDDRRVVGYAGAWIVPDPAGDQAHITNIVVAPAHRRRGVGRSLLLDLAREVIERGCVAWTLEVRASSEGAQAMYRRFGFAPAGIRRRYYDNREDAIVMWCHDIDSVAYAKRLEELTR